MRYMQGCVSAIVPLLCCLFHLLVVLFACHLHVCMFDCAFGVFGLLGLFFGLSGLLVWFGSVFISLFTLFLLSLSRALAQAQELARLVQCLSLGLRGWESFSSCEQLQLNRVGVNIRCSSCARKCSGVGLPFYQSFGMGICLPSQAAANVGPIQNQRSAYGSK